MHYLIDRIVGGSPCLVSARLTPRTAGVTMQCAHPPNDPLGRSVLHTDIDMTSAIESHGRRQRAADLVANMSLVRNIAGRIRKRLPASVEMRSEERRVGKECRA